MVPHKCALPLIIEPLGAIDKATAPGWRLIRDARLSNEYHDDDQSPCGVWYFSVAQLSGLLDVFDVMFAEDLEDAYHLSIFLARGCILVTCLRYWWTRPGRRTVAPRHGL